MKKRTSVIAGLALAIILLRCENSSTKDDELKEAVTIAESEIFELNATELFDRDINAARFGGYVFNSGMMVSGPHLFFGKDFPDCASVTVIGDDFPKDIIIDYGDGCTGVSELERTGIITIHMTNTILEPGGTYTITFDNVTLDGQQVEKTMTVTNEGLNRQGNWVVHSRSNSIVSVENEEEVITFTRDWSERKEWLSGFETATVEDDRFLKSGGGSIIVRKEIRFERSIVNPLLIDRTCKYPLSGIIHLIKKDEVISFDFGYGECDNGAIITKDRKSEEIDLEKSRFRNDFKRQNKHIKHESNWW